MKTSLTHALESTLIETPIGPMIAIADNDFLYLLEFTDCKKLDSEIERLKKRLRATISTGETEISRAIARELTLYFEGNLTHFQTPLSINGTFFQKSVWDALRSIVHGETRSYSQLAQKIGRPTACRAVAQANRSNQFAIIIPCHRVISSDGSLNGYAGGVDRKKWLLEFEKAR